ncbi:holin [Bacillus phage Saddex]|nr:holin [Bacillus phage Saddex]
MENKHEVFVPEEAPKIGAATIVRFIVFGVALINAIARLCGHELGLEIDQGVAYDIVSAILLFGSASHMAWKNNAVTKQARLREHAARQIDLDKGEVK